MEHMEFQNITTYDRAAYLILHRAVSQLNDRGQHPVYRAIRIVVPLLLLCSAVYFSFVQGPDPMLTAGGAMGALVLLWGLFPRQLRSLTARLSAPKGSSDCQLDFGPEGYQVTFTSSDGEQAASEVMAYDTIQEACQIPEGFVLLLTRQQGYFLSWSGFTHGTAEQFAARLPQWLGKPLTVLEP